MVKFRIVKEDKVSKILWCRCPEKRDFYYPIVPGFQITKVWDRNRKMAENMSKIFCDKAKVCDTFEEVSDDVDLVFIADCSGDGSNHLKLATPGLKKGVPTFVDKPFAYEPKEAQALVELAKKHNIPVMSPSILRVVPQATCFRNRFAELEKPEFGIIKGGEIHSPNIGDFKFPYGAVKILKMIKKMVRTRKSQALYNEMIECIAIASAARLAQKKGKRVYSKGCDVREG